MKINQCRETNEIVVSMTQEEKEMFIKLIGRHLDWMPKVYRKNHANWVVVSHMTNHGSGYSFAICTYLGIDPNGYEWVVTKSE